MLKKINVVLVFSVLVLSLKLNIGFSLFLPILLFYLLKDFKNIYYTYIPSLLTGFFFVRDSFFLLLGVLVLTLCFYYLITGVVHKKYPKLTPYVIVGYLVAMHTCTSFSLHINENISLFLVTNMLSVLLYLYLERYLYKIILENHETFDTMLSSLAYLEIMIAISTIASASTIEFFNVNLGFVYATFFAMYFGRSYKNIYSFVYGVASMLILYLGFHIPEGLFIPFVSALYLVSNLFLLFLFNVFMSTLLFTNTIYEINMLISMMVISIIFEVISPFLMEEKKTDKDMFEYIYNQIQKNTSDEILNFALFLDKFASGFQNPKEFNNRLSDGIKNLVQNHCNNCDKKRECFDKYKIELYAVFKSLLLQEPNFRMNYPEFCNYCPKISNFEHTAKFLESKIKGPISDENRAQNNIMLAQINGVSNAIKKYVIDLASKEELSYYQIILIKKRLQSYGYEVSYFEVIKLFVNDFNVKIGLQNIGYQDCKTTLKLIAENILNKEVSVILDHEERGNIYINLVPKIQIDITYGYGAISCDGEEICGDNYLIKEVSNGHFISAISDGMGKGYRAFYESDMTLKLVEDIIHLNLTSGTALEILNSFYAVQDYLEQYATLDFLEINRYNEMASFYKMGASTTYIFRANGTIEKILNKSLPFGLDEEISNVTYKINHGDLILMSSDGIFENIVDETELQNYIETIKNLPPQRIVYELLNYTIHSKIKTKDDMSVIALKIQKVA